MAMWSEVLQGSSDLEKAEKFSAGVLWSAETQMTIFHPREKVYLGEGEREAATLSQSRPVPAPSPR